MLQAPCHKCEDRVLGCHSTCEKYKKFKQENDALIEKIRNTTIANAIHIDACHKTMKRKNRKKRR